MTNLRRRLDNVLAELTIIHEALHSHSCYPPYCLKVHSNGKISCGIIGPLPEAVFLRECLKCRSEIKEFLDSLDKKIRERKAIS